MPIIRHEIIGNGCVKDNDNFQDPEITVLMVFLE